MRRTHTRLTTHRHVQPLETISVPTRPSSVPGTSGRTCHLLFFFLPIPPWGERSVFPLSPSTWDPDPWGDSCTALEKTTPITHACTHKASSFLQQMIALHKNKRRIQFNRQAPSPILLNSRIFTYARSRAHVRSENETMACSWTSGVQVWFFYFVWLKAVETQSPRMSLSGIYSQQCHAAEMTVSYATCWDFVARSLKNIIISISEGKRLEMIEFLWNS